MINRDNAKINTLVVHGLAGIDKPSKADFSKSETKVIDHDLAEAFFKNAIDVFKEPVFFNFDLNDDTEVKNTIFQHCQEVFHGSSSLYEASLPITNYLNEKFLEHNIGQSYFILLHIKDLVLDDELVDGIALLKLEQKERFFKLEKLTGNHTPKLDSGFLVGKSDSVCLILNTNEDVGYKILNKEINVKTSKLWREDFLNLIHQGNNYSYTTDYVKLTSNFIKNRKPLDELLGKTEAVNILNRSFDYFNENEKFDEKEFKSEVFSDKKLIEAFDTYKDKWQEKNQKSLASQFDVSDFALNKQSKVFRSVIKLDKNFHIYVHGDHSKIERGIDESGRKYYILYYNEES